MGSHDRGARRDCKRPVAAGRGSGGRDFAIAPGEPDASILVYRMESTDPGIAMPELGRATVHAEGRRTVARMDRGDAENAPAR
jgi:hypothetical protein